MPAPFHITRAMADAAYDWIAAEAKARGYANLLSMVSKAEVEQAAAQCFQIMWDAAPLNYDPRKADPPPGAARAPAP